MRIVLFIGALMIFILPPTVFPQANQDVCRVTTTTWDKDRKFGTGINELGKFPLTRIDESTDRTFTFENSDADLLVSVSVEYQDFQAVKKGKPTEIFIRIGVSDKAIGSSNDSDNVVAGTTYDRRWGSIFVSKDAVRGDHIYRFTLTCSDGISKNGVKRQETRTKL